MGDDFQRLKTDSTQFTQSQGPAVHTALDAYVVSRQKTPGYPSITSLIGIIDELHKDNSRFKNYFRQIETELSQGNYLEAQRIMERKQRNLLEQSVSNDGVQGQIETLNKVKAHFFELSEQPSETYDWWHWMANSSQSESHKQTIITDILTAMKFKEELAHDTTQA